MNKLIIWFVLFAVVMIGAVGAYWWFDLRWRPKTITRHQAEIAQILEQAGWVSPGLTGPKLYIVGFRSCPDCVRLKAEEFPKFHKAGVDTRMIEIARGEYNGVMKSTPVERTTVAELWINRSWPLLESWDAVPVDAWTAQGLPPADGDMARTAVVQAGRDMVDKLKPLLKDNGVSFAYPLLVWWTKGGVMRACACERRETYRFVRRELGAG